MFPRRCLIIAPLLAAAALAPNAAAADPVTYDVNAFTFVKGTASGSDADGWSSASSYETEIAQQIHDIPANPDGTTGEVAAPSNSFGPTRLKQDYALATAAGTISWNCANSGDAQGAPGTFKLTQFGPTMTAEVVVAQSLTQARSCTGFSSFTGDIVITEAPLKATFSFPASELADGAYSTQIDTTLPCGEWTIFQTDCTLRFGGSISIARHGGVVEEEEQPKPETKAVLMPKAKGATVTVKCATACSGSVSATAIAKGKQAAKRVGTKSFSSTQAGTQSVKVIFGKNGTRTARQRGAVVIDVNASGQSTRYRLKTR